MRPFRVGLLAVTPWPLMTPPAGCFRGRPGPRFAGTEGFASSLGGGGILGTGSEWGCATGTLDAALVGLGEDGRGMVGTLYVYGIP